MMDIDLQEEYRRLGDSYDAFERLLGEEEATLYRTSEDVSKWSRAQHLYHILVSDGMMLKGIQLICRGGDRILPEGGLNDAGRYILSRGVFPRGKGQAPQSVVPPEVPSREALRQAFERSRRQYDEAAAVLPEIPSAAGFLRHPFLGDLDAAQWLRLARIHSEHHLAIIEEIADA